MRSILRATLLIAVVLLVPILPLLFLGLSFEDRVIGWFEQELSDGVRFALIVAVLAGDLFLPIPSSMVSTYGGGILGTWPATAASWLGMTLGAAAGFGLARVFGNRFSARYAGAGDLQQMAALSRKFGPLALVLTRALPILAEACVLLMGATRLSWRRFLVPVLAGNFVVSLTYAACGEYFEGKDALLLAVLLSGIVPLGIAVIARRWLNP
jgi:uncharacterized membrane protein YdjX (TVP38/TMEM64 family)